MKDKKHSIREFPEGQIPLLSIQGKSREAGRMLGFAWLEAIRLRAQSVPAGSVPWWKEKSLQKIIARLAPHLPDLFVGMANGAGVDEDKIDEQLPPDWDSGCTSVALRPAVTLDHIPISGQTKDTPERQQFRYVVLRLKLDDAPSALTLTYPGLIFGHGFVTGGCSIFRNSVSAGAGHGRLPYFVWGILSLHCPRVSDVVELTRAHGVRGGFHCSIADEHGGVVGIEYGKGGMAVLKPSAGIYTHANAICGGKKLQKFEQADPTNSIQRQTRLRELLEPNSGKLTSQLVYSAFSDHEYFPLSICRHEAEHLTTTAAVVVEPTRRLLHATCGYPCRNWPVTYQL